MTIGTAAENDRFLGSLRELLCHPDPHAVSSRRLSRSRWLAALGVSAVSAMSVACAEGASGVTRMANGVRYEGRFINPEAYAAYAVGIEHEARGEFGKAITCTSKPARMIPKARKFGPELAQRSASGQSPNAGRASPRAPLKTASASTRLLRQLLRARPLCRACAPFRLGLERRQGRGRPQAEG